MNTAAPIYEVLNRTDPGRFVYAPNYRQWLAHHSTHRMLLKKIIHCQCRRDMINYLGLDVFSRNICWLRDAWKKFRKTVP